MSSPEHELQQLYAALNEQDQAALLAFAQFLKARGQGLPMPNFVPAPRAPVVKPEIPEPSMEPRPETESVVKAVKRLSRSYHMLDKSKMLNETAALVTQHIVQGRDAVEVIDELEVIFERSYQEMRAEADGDS